MGLFIFVIYECPLNVGVLKKNAFLPQWRMFLVLGLQECLIGTIFRPEGIQAFTTL
jgi:hypothetical protein